MDRKASRTSYEAGPSRWDRFLHDLLDTGSPIGQAGLVLLVAGLAAWGWFDVRQRANTSALEPWVHKTDFTVYTEAGAAFFDGRPPYEVCNPRGWRYLYAPLFAICVAPLHDFSPQTQVLVWFAISCLMALGCVHEMRRLIQRSLQARAEQNQRRAVFPWWIGMAALGTTLLPALNCVQRGQLGVGKLYLLLLGFRFILQSSGTARAIIGGIVLALPIVWKLTPILPVAFFIGILTLQAWPVRADSVAGKRLAGAALGTVAGLLLFYLAVPALCVGWSANLRHLNTWYQRVLLHTSDAGQDDFAGNPHGIRNQSLSNGVYRLGNWCYYMFAGGPHDQQLDAYEKRPEHTPMDAPRIVLALHVVRAGLLILLLAVGVRAARDGDEIELTAAFGLACVATLVVSPVARAHYFVLWLPAACGVPLWLCRRGKVRMAVTTAAIPLLLTLLTYAFFEQLGRLGLLGIGTTVWYAVACGLLLRGGPERNKKGHGNSIHRPAMTSILKRDKPARPALPA